MSKLVLSSVAVALVLTLSASSVKSALASAPTRTSTAAGMPTGGIASNADDITGTDPEPIEPNLMGIILGLLAFR